MTQHIMVHVETAKLCNICVAQSFPVALRRLPSCCTLLFNKFPALTLFVPLLLELLYLPQLLLQRPHLLLSSISSVTASTAYTSTSQLHATNTRTTLRVGV